MRTILMTLLMITGTVNTGRLFETDTFRTENGTPLEITFVGHASLILNYGGHIVYVDPVSEYADYSRFPKADVVLITHAHADHLDSSAIEAVEKQATKLVVNAASRESLGKGLVMKNGDRLQPVPWLQVEAVPAYNITPGREIYHPKDRDNGYVLTLGGMRIYIAGDTENIPEIAELRNIDIAFLPVNQPYTMTVQQAARAAKMFKPRILYPYHYGNTDIEGVKNILKGSGIDVRIRKLQ